MFRNILTYRAYTIRLLAVAAVLLLYSCHKVQHHISTGIYYWKTVYAPGPYELQRLQQMHCRTMYLRLYDVEWNATRNEAVPVAPLRLPQQMDKRFRYVPVVFIKQEALLHIKDSSLPSFAAHINAMTAGMCNAAGIQPDELQMDCDWTGSTRDKYFSLLKLLKDEPWFKGKTISATIRMHQVKYKQGMGIPPVDKGLLMCYNMGDIKKYDAENSIIDPDVAEQYLDYLGTYPLKLDIALPLFDWCLLFRDKKFRGILRDVEAVQLKGNKLFRSDAQNRYTCLRDTLWQGYTLQKGDVLRLEDARVADIESVAAYTARKIKQDSLNVVFFHCDSLILSKYSADELEKVLDSYR